MKNYQINNYQNNQNNQIIQNNYQILQDHQKFQNTQINNCENNQVIISNKKNINSYNLYEEKRKALLKTLSKKKKGFAKYST